MTHIGPVYILDHGDFSALRQYSKQVIDWVIQSGEKRAQKNRCGFFNFSSCCCNCIAMSSVCLSVSIDAPSMGFACRVFEGLL